MDYYWKRAPSANVVDNTLEFRLAFNELRHPEQFEKTWWSVLIELSETSIDGFEAGLSAASRDQLLIPVDYTLDDRQRVIDHQSVSVFALPELLRLLNTGGPKFSVVGLILGATCRQDFLSFDLPLISKVSLDIPVLKGTVLTAVIDDGIAFAHNLFRSSLTTSRIEFVNILASKPSKGRHKSSVGRILRRYEIDRLLEKHTHSDILDERQFYQDAGLFNVYQDVFSTAALSSSHGTHVMGLAAGYPYDVAPLDRPILCALLPAAVTDDASGNNLLPSLKLAMKRLINQAGQFYLPDGSRPPVAFNLSYGNSSGPHDGTGPVETAIERYFKEPAHRKRAEALHECNAQVRRIALPAGNGNLSRTHAKVQFVGKVDRVSCVLDFEILPDDRTASFVELWMPYVGPDPKVPPVAVKVTVPNGPTSRDVTMAVGKDEYLYDENECIVARLIYEYRGGKTDRGLILLIVNPTASLGCQPLARAGQWKIEVIPHEIAPDHAIEVWVARDETIRGYRPGGRQGYFDNSDYVRFDRLGAPLPVDPRDGNCPVKRAGTLNGIACGSSPIVLAGFTRSNNLLSDYSAAGPITPKQGNLHADRDGPDAAALSDQSPALPGVLSAGSRSGSIVRLGGTSEAAPRATRLIVENLAEGGPGDRQWIYKLAMENDPGTGERPPSTRTGGGRVDVEVDLADLPTPSKLGL